MRPIYVALTTHSLLALDVSVMCAPSDAVNHAAGRMSRPGVDVMCGGDNLIMYVGVSCGAVTTQDLMRLLMWHASELTIP